MPSFVQADPPLASSDHVHFTSLGVNLVAEMFYKALMLEYSGYSDKMARAQAGRAGRETEHGAGID